MNSYKSSPSLEIIQKMKRILCMKDPTTQLCEFESCTCPIYKHLFSNYSNDRFYHGSMRCPKHSYHKNYVCQNLHSIYCCGCGVSEFQRPLKFVKLNDPNYTYLHLCSQCARPFQREFLNMPKTTDVLGMCWYGTASERPSMTDGEYPVYEISRFWTIFCSHPSCSRCLLPTNRYSLYSLRYPDGAWFCGDHLLNHSATSLSMYHVNQDRRREAMKNANPSVTYYDLGRPTWIVQNDPTDHFEVVFNSSSIPFLPMHPKLDPFLRTHHVCTTCQEYFPTQILRPYWNMGKADSKGYYLQPTHSKDMTRTHQCCVCSSTHYCSQCDRTWLIHPHSPKFTYCSNCMLFGVDAGCLAFASYIRSQTILFSIFPDDLIFLILDYLPLLSICPSCKQPVCSTCKFQQHSCARCSHTIRDCYSCVHSRLSKLLKVKSESEQEQKQSSFEPVFEDTTDTERIDRLFLCEACFNASLLEYSSTTLLGNHARSSSRKKKMKYDPLYE